MNRNKIMSIKKYSRSRNQRTISQRFFLGLSLLASSFCVEAQSDTWYTLWPFNGAPSHEQIAYGDTADVVCQKRIPEMRKSSPHSPIVGCPTKSEHFIGLQGGSCRIDYLYDPPPGCNWNNGNSAIIKYSFFSPQRANCTQMTSWTDAIPRPFRCGSFYVSAIPPADPGCPSDCVGDPINPVDGNVYRSDRDVVESDTEGPLPFARFYNSLTTRTASMSPGWSHSFSRSIHANYVISSPRQYTSSVLNSSQYSDPAAACTSGFSQIQSQVPSWSDVSVTFTNGVCVLIKAGTRIGTLPIYSTKKLVATDIAPPVSYDVLRDDGRIIIFTVESGVIIPPPGVMLKLQITDSGYSLTDEDDSTETYSSDGLLQAITNRSGATWSMTYTGQKLTQISNPFGRVLALTYDTQKRLSSLADSNLKTVNYSYDTQGRFSAVTYQDTTSRTYTYENSSFPHALTGVLDENGSQFSTWAYDSQGRGTSTAESNGANAHTLTYNSNGSVTVTDALGAVRTFIFGRNGNRKLIIGISGSQCPTCREGKETTYDSNGLPSTRTDYNNNVVTYEYDDTRGLETSRTQAYGTARERTITTEWHPTYRLPVQVNAPTLSTSYLHDENGNVLTRVVTDTSLAPNASRTWTYTYNSFGQILTVDGPRTDVSDVTAYTYHSCTSGSQCGQIHTITNAAGHITTYSAYNAHGQPLTITDPNGVTTTLTYDLRQRLTSRTVSGEQSVFAYWPTGLLKRVTLPDSSYIEYAYDAAHRLTKISDSEGNYIVYTLDAMGNRIAEQVFDQTSTLTQTRTRVFDALNQLRSQIGAAGTADVTTEFSYDNNSNQINVAAPLARSTAKSYDELNRLTQVTDSLLGTTQYDYNALDQLVSITDPRGKITSYSYGALGNLTQLVSPDTGATTNTYDSTGNLATRTDARGKIATYTYDALNRVKSVAYPDQTLSYTYDTGLNQKGRLKHISDASGTTNWSYDPLGRVLSRQQSMGVTKTINYAYDVSGRLQTLTLPSGNTVLYSYNYGKVTSLTLNGATTLLSNVLYQPFGPTQGWTWGNATLAVRQYNLDGLITAIDSAALQTYNHDAASRIISLTDSDIPSLSQHYGYDALDRLTSATGPALNQNWTYDANGNRLSQGGIHPSTYMVSINSNQISAVTGALAQTYTYDATGNLTDDGSATFTYNDAGRLVSVTTAGVTATYAYNALGQRVKKVVGGTANYFAYDEAGHLIGEYDTAGNLIQETVWFGDIPVALLKPNGSGGTNVFYIHTDHLNTPRRISQPSDNRVVWRWDSDPFGTTAADEDPDGDSHFFNYNLRFPGQYYDAESGLYYNWNRYYDPSTGRYLQSDPIGLAGGLNTYAYVGGNPISYIDPEGLNPAAGALGGAEIGTLIFPGPGTLIGGAIGLGIGIWATDQVIGMMNKDGSESKPDNCPSGTVPIDKAKGKFGIDKDGIHGIKKGVGARPTTWTGIAPNGDVWTGGAGGVGENHGPFGDYLPGGQ